MSLEGIKPGDLLCCRAQPSYTKYQITLAVMTVERVTAKQGTLKNGKKFWLKDGRVVGYSFTQLRRPTSEEIEQHKVEKKIQQRYISASGWFNSLNRSELSVEQLEAMQAALEGAKTGSE